MICCLSVKTLLVQDKNLRVWQKSDSDCNELPNAESEMQQAKLPSVARRDLNLRFCASASYPTDRATVDLLSPILLRLTMVYYSPSNSR